MNKNLIKEREKDMNEIEIYVKKKMKTRIRGNSIISKDVDKIYTNAIRNRLHDQDLIVI